MIKVVIMRNLRGLIIVTAVLILISLNNFSINGESRSLPGVGYLIEFTQKPGNQNNVCINGDYIVWSDDILGSDCSIYLHNLSNGTTMKIPEYFDNNLHEIATVWGEKVVIASVNYSANDYLLLYNISTNELSSIRTGLSFLTAADIYEDLIVYSYRKESYFDVFMFNISSWSETRITDKSSNQISPKIMGDHIYYLDRNATDSVIQMYNIRTQETIPLDSYSSGSMSNFDVSENGIVWLDSTMDGFSYRTKIMYSNFSMYIGHHQLYETENNIMDISIDQHKIVWSEAFPDFTVSVFYFDLETYQTHCIMRNCGVVYEISVSGSYAVFDTFHGLSEEIMLFTFDRDDDGIGDSEDAFPFNPYEFIDTDRDGMGDNLDPDLDNDGVVDEQDAFPYDASEWMDFDRDGIGDNQDLDDDNDGVYDEYDINPYNPMDPWLSQFLTEKFDHLDTRFDSLRMGVHEDIWDAQGENEEDLMNLIDKIIQMNVSSNAGNFQIIENLTFLSDSIKENEIESNEFILQLLTNISSALEENIATLMVQINNGYHNTEESLEGIEQSLELLDELESIMTEMEMMNEKLEKTDENVEKGSDSIKSLLITNLVIMIILGILVIFALFAKYKEKSGFTSNME